jgi:hypothetical protein
MLPIEIQSTFRRKMSPPSSRLRNRPRWSQHVSPKRRLTFNVLHGVISRKIKLLIYDDCLLITTFLNGEVNVTLMHSIMFCDNSVGYI